LKPLQKPGLRSRRNGFSTTRFRRFYAPDDVKTNARGRKIIRSFARVPAKRASGEEACRRTASWACAKGCATHARAARPARSSATESSPASTASERESPASICKSPRLFHRLTAECMRDARVFGGVVVGIVRPRTRSNGMADVWICRVVWPLGDAG
jgi:hypothetical protein